MILSGGMMNDKKFTVSEEEQLAELSRKSDLVFIGLVAEVGAPPAYWSGRVPAYQRVTYTVEEVLKGAPLQQVSVDHIVVMGSKTAEPGEEPGLSRRLFHKDAKLLVFVQTEDGNRRCLDEDRGAVAYTPGTLANVKKALKR